MPPTARTKPANAPSARGHPDGRAEPQRAAWPHALTRPVFFRSQPLARMPFLSIGSVFALSSVLIGNKVTGDLDFGFPPEKIDLAARLAGKNVILVGLPGAFTPT